MSKQNLRIFSLNIDSVVHLKRKNLLMIFLKENNVDICLLQETKLDNSIRFFIPNYFIIRNDDIRGRSGTAIIIRNNIRFKDSILYKDIFQSISCRIFFNNKWHSISSVYFPPRPNVDWEVFRRFFVTHKNRLMGGDFNAKHSTFGDQSFNHYGILLRKARDVFKFSIINPTSPTCYHFNCGSHIDKFISFNSKLDINNMSVVPSFSDHMSIKILAYGVTNSITLPTRFAFDFINVEGFNKYVDLNVKRIVMPINRNLTKKEVDDILLEFNSIIGIAINKSVPKVSTNSTSIFKSSRETMLIRNYCKRLQGRLIRNGTNMQFHTKNIIIGQIKQLKIMIKNSANSDTARSFSKIYENIKDTREVFDVIKRFTGHKRRDTMGGSLLLSDDSDATVTGVVDIATALGNNFIKNHNITTNSRSPFEEIVREDMNKLSNTNLVINFNGNVSPKIIDNKRLDMINDKLPVVERNLLTSAEEKFINKSFQEDQIRNRWVLMACPIQL